MYHEVASRLERRLGLGEFPMVRRRLFARLQRLCQEKGDGPLQVIAALVQEAEGPKIRDKGQYFCWVVKRRLAEAGWPIDVPSAVPLTPTQVEAVAAIRENLAKPVPTDRPSAENNLREVLAKRAREEVVSRLRAHGTAEGGVS